MSRFLGLVGGCGSIGWPGLLGWGVDGKEVAWERNVEG